MIIRGLGDLSINNLPMVAIDESGYVIDLLSTDMAHTKFLRPTANSICMGKLLSVRPLGC
jgi:hypothetical protein